MDLGPPAQHHLILTNCTCKGPVKGDPDKVTV